MAVFLNAERIRALFRCVMGPGKKRALLAALALGIFLGGCGTSSDIRKIFAASFSPDNGKLIFTLCRKDKPCTIATYDLAAKTLHEFPTPPEDGWMTPAFSRDGTTIAFAKGKKDTPFNQIAIMNSDGSSVREVTHGKALRGFPSFSPDGKRIIYVEATRFRDTGVNRAVDRDIFEVDIESGRETRLTDYHFYSADRPYYLPDGTRFIFAGYGPTRPSGLAGVEQYEERYQRNTIFIMGGYPRVLQPAFTLGEDSFGPSISADGSKILFLALTNDMDDVKGKYNFDLFLNHEGQFTRLTQAGWYIKEAAISLDGQKIVFVADRQRNREYSMWTMNVDGGELTEVTIPE